jgi:membrane-bound inhibitor of C-type lysozyme
MNLERCLPRHRRGPIALLLMLAGVLAGCGAMSNKTEEEAARNTFACQLAGERLVIRFEPDEVRLLMPDGDRVVLYKIASATGARFSNGNFELTGKGTDLMLAEHGSVRPLANCESLAAKK